MKTRPIMFVNVSCLTRLYCLTRATYLTQESQQFETAIVDLELRRARKAAHAIREVVKQIEKILGHFVAMSEQLTCSCPVVFSS